MMTSPNVAMEVYEDEKGYLEFLAHNRGRFRSQPKDVEALQSMAKWGVVITPAFKSTFRMDDDEFVSILLKEIETKLTVEAQRGYPERIKELTLWPVTVEYVEKYAGTEEKGVKFPAIMVRYSEGIPSSDYYYKGPLILEETYVRRWRVYKYVKPGAGDQKGYLSEVAGESRLEPRLDLPSAGAPNK